MKSKKFKRVNRGLILAGIAFGVTAVYVTADTITFNSNRATIEKTVVDYTNACAEAIIPATALSEINHSWSDAEVSAFKDKLSAPLSYFTDTYDGISGEYTVKADISNDIISLDPKTDITGYVISSSANIKSMKITKTGPGAAKFTCTLNSVVQYVGNACYSDFSGYSLIHSDTKNDETNQLTSTYEFYGELLYENSQWKISYVDSILIDRVGSIQ